MSMAGGVLSQTAEEVSEQGLQGWDGKGDQSAGDFGVFDTQHGIVGPAPVRRPLPDDDKPDADGRDDDDARQK